MDEKGTIPFLGATEKHNGITGYTTKQTISSWNKVGLQTNNELKSRLFYPTSIAVTNNGSVGNAYLMEHEYTSSHDVTTLKLIDHKLTRELALFLITVLKISGSSFSYARKWRPKRLRKTNILLPIDSLGNPNFEYMEQFIVNNEFKDLSLSLSSSTNDMVDLSSVKWDAITLSDYFSIYSVPPLDANKINHDGEIPYISRSQYNNGLEFYTDVHDNKNLVHVKNPVITIGNETATPFVQNFNFYTGTKVQVLVPKLNLSISTLLFVKSTIFEATKEFSYSFTINKKRLKTLKIMLPINEKNQPDWAFMENYINEISNSRYI